MTWRLAIENVAGIRRAEAAVEPGVNVVRASNWQGKSSFLAGIEAVLGTDARLTEGQERGRVSLRTDEAEYAVDLTRSDGAVRSAGTPYLDDEYDRVCASLFAVLGESNDVRAAVRDGRNLAAVLTRPLDFENIDERIADRRAERDRVEAELDRAEDAAERLPRLQRRVTSLEADLASLRERRADLDAAEGERPARDRLSDRRAERDRLDSRIERLAATAESVRDSLAEAREELDALDVPAGEDVADELERRRADLRDVERDRELLQSVYEANRRVLDAGRLELLTDVSREVIADDVTCWVCGAEASTETVEERLAALEDRIDEHRRREREVRDRVDELEERREAARAARRRERDLEDRIADLERRLAETEESLETARAERETLTDEIAGLAETVETVDERVTDLESEIKYTEAELADAREDLEAAETRAADRDALQEQYEALSGEIEDLRTRKDRVERRTREAFSAALADVLEAFDTGFEGAHLTGSFDLVVARDGRETRLASLSDGERELLGIVAALAGHAAFDVADRVPVLLLDDLGALTESNLRRLVAVLRGRAPYLVLTAYPEHAAVDGNELSPADWRVVSRDADASAPS
ncbi:MAG: archaea-specific SMC-related protein [Halobacteriaceae archaeon]